VTATIALVGAVDGGVLRAAGWQVKGALHLTPYDDLRDVPSYAAIEDLLADDALDAVAVDGADSLVAQHLPALLAKGLHVLLTSCAPLDPDLLASARGAAEAGDAEVVVTLVQRWEPWALTVAAAMPLVGSPVTQATIRGWPRGMAAAAEVVDLARSWCGDVLSAIAAPAPLPADELEDGTPVAWALLHESGATTLVSHEGAPPLVRLSFATARLEAGPLGARWVGGVELPLLPHDPFGDDPAPRSPTPPGTPVGTIASARRLLQAVPDRTILPTEWPWPADLGDAQAIGRVLAALRESARAEAPTRVG
jgi:hypothetical protein